MWRSTAHQCSMSRFETSVQKHLYTPKSKKECSVITLVSKFVRARVEIAKMKWYSTSTKQCWTHCNSCPWMGCWVVAFGVFLGDSDSAVVPLNFDARNNFRHWTNSPVEATGCFPLPLRPANAPREESLISFPCWSKIFSCVVLVAFKMWRRFLLRHSRLTKSPKPKACQPHHTPQLFRTSANFSCRWICTSP